MYISPSRYITLINALKMIPGVKPRVMKKELERIQSSLWSSDYISQKEGIIETSKFIYGSLSLVYSDFNELFINDDWGTIRISPKGAQLLLLLDKEGFFKRNSSVEPTELIQYIESEEDIIKVQIDSDEEERRKRELVLNLELVEEKDFNYELLNNIFIHRFGLSRQMLSMLIGGIEVTKNIVMYKSNSGKNSDATVVFKWQSTDGQNNTIIKESIYSNNRRNDAERNWGLPE